jgi:hypothetical protein
VFVPARKELHFFGGGRYELGLDRYASWFAGAGDARAVGEATPGYLYFRQAVERIARDLPTSTVFLAILRNPVDRAYSQYWHAVRRGAITGSFEQALADEPRLLARPSRSDLIWRSLTSRGRYPAQLRHFADRVGRDRLRVVFFEELRADHRAVGDELAGFLGVRRLGRDWPALPHGNQARRLVVDPRLRWFVNEHAPYRINNVADRALSRRFRPPPMAPATRARLLDGFAADNLELAAWLGRDLPEAWGR